MKVSVPLAAALIVSATVPAFATNYYVVKDHGSKGCNVIDSTPTSKDDVLGYPTVYQNKDRADQAMKNDKACNNG
jgi:hypothetical protein